MVWSPFLWLPCSSTSTLEPRTCKETKPECQRDLELLMILEDHLLPRFLPHSCPSSKPHHPSSMKLQTSKLSLRGYLLLTINMSNWKSQNTGVNFTWAKASRIILIWGVLTPPPAFRSIAFRSTNSSSFKFSIRISPSSFGLVTSTQQQQRRALLSRHPSNCSSLVLYDHCFEFWIH